MKRKLFALFFLSALLYFLPERFTFVENKESAVLSIVDSKSENIDRVVEEMLALQRSLLAVPDTNRLSREQKKNGFLLFQMRPEYVMGLIEENNARLIVARKSGELAGYLLLADVSEFVKLFQNPETGRWENSMGHEEQENFLLRQMKYIEQIAVRPENAKEGIGRSLVDQAKKLSYEGLVADVLIEPVHNDASLAFFSKMGFKEIGVIYQEPRADFTAHKTCVFFWSQEEARP